MPPMNGIADRGWFIKAIEACANGDGSSRSNFLDDLRDLRLSVTEVFFRQGILDRANSTHVAMATHLNKDWFGSAGSTSTWWSALPSKEAIVRHGLIRALSMDAMRPLNLLWICSSDQFLCVVDSSDHQVDLVVLTPPIPTDYLAIAGFIRETVDVVGHYDYMLATTVAAAKGSGLPTVADCPVLDSTARVYLVPVFSD